MILSLSSMTGFLHLLDKNARLTTQQGELTSMLPLHSIPLNVDQVNFMAIKGHIMYVSGVNHSDDI